DQLVPDDLVGTGLSNDKVSTRVDKRLQQRATKAVSAARAFARTLAKKSDQRMAVDEAVVPFFRAAPVKGPELPAMDVPPAGRGRPRHHPHPPQRRRLARAARQPGALRSRRLLPLP